jgi:hypothetical protein
MARRVTTTQDHTTMLTTTPTAPPPPSSPSEHANSHRSAWLIGGSVFAVIALAYGLTVVIDLLSFGRSHFEQTFAEPITTLEIDSDGGSVRVEGTTGNETVVLASLRRGLRAPTHRESLVGDRLVLDSDCPAFFTSFCGVSYTVRVPAHVAVIVTSSGGGVRVSDLSGSVDISSSGGGVRATGVTGTLRMRSSGGGVTGDALRTPDVDASSSGGGVRLTFAIAPTTVRAQSSGGGVTVEVPNTPETYRLDATSSGGGVSTSVRSDPTSSRSIEVRSSGGGVTVRYPR